MELNDLMDLIKNGEKIVIELGCGEKKQPGTIGIDKLPLKNVDYVWDLEKGLSFLPDNSVDEIRSKHFLEHVEHFEELTKEIHRVLKPGGIQIVTVPHFSNPYYYSDFTHRRFFGLYSYDYFSEPEFQLRRKVPAFYVDYRFRIKKRRLVFKSPTFFFRNIFKVYFLDHIFNMNSYFQELYEEVFVYIFPCQEVTFVMEVIK